jgi:hypothetical protein
MLSGFGPLPVHQAQYTWTRTLRIPDAVGDEPGQQYGKAAWRMGRNTRQERRHHGRTQLECEWKRHWDRVGIVPELPQELVDQLPKPSKAKAPPVGTCLGGVFTQPSGSGAVSDSDAATNAEVAQFFLDHRGGGSLGLVRAVVQQQKKQIRDGESRHVSAMSAMAWAMEEAAAGLYPASEAALTIRDVFIKSLAQPKDNDKRVVEGDLAESEWSGIRAWAVGHALAKTEADHEAIRKKATMVNGLTAAQMDEFWTARPYLTHLRNYARARGVNPLGMLATALVRANCTIPTHVVLPPLVGGQASLNLFAALVGPSGIGKGGSESAEKSAIRWRDPFSDEVISIPTLPVGTGEGIARTFQPVPGEETLDAAIFTAAEVETLSSLFGRNGGTLESVLRMLWMGEELGFTNSQKATRILVPRLSYRAGMIVGVPLRADPLLRGVGGGTPQRFIWMPVLDPDIPDEQPDAPEPMFIDQPKWLGVKELAVPRIVRDEVWEHHKAMHRGQTNEFNVHAKLARIKGLCGVDGPRRSEQT